MNQMIIAMPESERQSFLATMATVEDRANAFTDACIEILVEGYNAIEEGVKRDIFYLSAVYHLVSGNPLPEPKEAVLEAMRMYKAKYLGMEWED